MATEKRLIVASTLMDTIKKRVSTAYPNELWGLMLAQDFIEDAPTVDAVEVVHGRWINPSKPYLQFNVLGICSECGTWKDRNYNYCPNCGAKMDGDGNG